MSKDKPVQKYALSRYFGGGVHHVVRFHDTNTLLFSRHRKYNGSARYVPHVKRYVRNGVEYRSLAALLRAVNDEVVGRNA